MGHRREVARPGTLRPEAGLPLGPRPRVELFRPVHRHDGPDQRVRRPGPADGSRDRLADLAEERVGPPAGSHRHAAPAPPVLQPALCALAYSVSFVPRTLPGPATGLLPPAETVA